MNKEYKSPEYKLVKFFESSRDGWKEKASERALINRDLEAQVRDLKKSRKLWKEKAQGIKEKKEKEEKELQKVKEQLAQAEKKIKMLESENDELKKNIPF
jgi:SMC interacting uncharacterized protein involved in chromosome segregation